MNRNRIFLSLIIALCVLSTKANAESTDLRVMTFNLRYATANDGPDAWPLRRAMVFDVLRDFDPDVLGVQEAMRLQLDQLEKELPQYVAIGAGRSSTGGGEYSSILFRRDRFDLWESGTFWLSDTPTVPGSTSWGNGLPRICVWVRLQNRKTGRRFYVFNTHWDHQSQTAREKSGLLIAERIKNRGAQSEPIIMLGDFNAGEKNPARVNLNTAGLRDSYRDISPDATDNGTFHFFKGGKRGRKIDAVLVSKQWKITQAAIDHTNKKGRYPSDHFPVTATLRLVEQKQKATVKKITK